MNIIPTVKLCADPSAALKRGFHPNARTHRANASKMLACNLTQAVCLQCVRCARCVWLETALEALHCDSSRGITFRHY